MVRTVLAADTGGLVGFDQLRHEEALYRHTLKLAARELHAREDTLVNRAIVKLDALKRDGHFGTVFSRVDAGVIF